jgi:tetratricopeptide (TPR) repeat protein
MSRFLFLLSFVIFGAGFLAFFFPGYNAWGIAGVAGGLLLFIYAKRSSIFLFMANMAFTSGGRTKALTWLGRAYKAGSLPVSIRITYGYQLLKEDRLKDAQAVFDEVQSSLGSKGGKKDLYLTQTYVALLRWQQGNRVDAIEILQNLLEKDYKTANLYGLLGYFLLETSNASRALQVNMQAKDFDSQDPAILDNLGANYLKIGKIDLARNTLETLIETEPSFPEAWYHWGQTQEALGQRDLAREAYQRALELDFHGLTTIRFEQVKKALQTLEAAEDTSQEEKNKG